jgi:hypothetical protein
MKLEIRRAEYAGKELVPRELVEVNDWKRRGAS